jgi:hypothetical protein
MPRSIGERAGRYFPFSRRQNIRWTATAEIPDVLGNRAHQYVIVIPFGSFALLLTIDFRDVQNLDVGHKA